MEMNVLIIDNDLLRCGTWGGILKAYGYDVIEATRIESIAKISEDFRIDVVIARSSFSRSHGEQLRGAINKIDPRISIVVFGEEDLDDRSTVVDAYLRPTLFHTDLRSFLQSTRSRRTVD
jgi:DNA-binding NtrC family response regulator